MEEIYINVHYAKTSPKQTAARSSEKRFHGAAVLCPGLMTVFLLAGLIGLGVHYDAFVRGSTAELSAITANLTECLLDSDYKISSLTEERDLLKVNLTSLTEERDLLKRTCHAGWRRFGSACYLLSSASGSWEKGREDCQARGADLVVIGSAGEQMFLSNFTKEETFAWIGLTDRVKESTWVWVDGAPLSLQFWQTSQPDNGSGHVTYGEEDCAHTVTGRKNLQEWNDLSCDASRKWICEKMV